MRALVTMRKTLLASAALLLGASLPWQANAATVNFTFAGPGVSGTLQLTYGTATDGKYPRAFEVTGISGTFSDSNNGLNIVNAPVGPLEPIRHDAPESTNLLAPLDFSKFAVAAGLGPDNNGFLTYDNLFYPDPSGSPQTASDYPVPWRNPGYLRTDVRYWRRQGRGPLEQRYPQSHRRRWSCRLRRRGRHPRYCIRLCRR